MRREPLHVIVARCAAMRSREEVLSSRANKSYQSILGPAKHQTQRPEGLNRVKSIVNVTYPSRIVKLYGFATDGLLRGINLPPQGRPRRKGRQEVLHFTASATINTCGTAVLHKGPILEMLTEEPELAIAVRCYRAQSRRRSIELHAHAAWSAGPARTFHSCGCL